MMPSVKAPYVVAAFALVIGTARLTLAGPLFEDDDLDYGARERPLQRATSYVDALIPLEFQVRRRKCYFHSERSSGVRILTSSNLSTQKSL